MIGHRTYRWQTWASGLANSDDLKNVYKNSFGYTAALKKVSAGSSTAVLAATATSTSSQTVVDGITQPDVPRQLTVTAGGTAGAFLGSGVVVTGTNVEGKVITESFQLTSGATGTVNGSKAFKSVTSVFIPAQAAATGTVAVGTRNNLGTYHRLIPNNTTVKVFSRTTVDGTGTTTLQAAPTVVTNGSILELNAVTPAVTPDGTTYLAICYAHDQWSTQDLSDDPVYATSTSTSTSSTSTSTTTTPTTSTSTSSTSTSSTSTSVSTSSTSTSSTSTSTTTVP